MHNIRRDVGKHVGYRVNLQAGQTSTGFVTERLTMSCETGFGLNPSVSAADRSDGESLPAPIQLNK
jgi:hypothetical protein